MSEAKNWVQVQQKTFTKWLNNHLRKKGFEPMENVEVEFEDGIKLMQIINALYDTPIPKHTKTPKMRMQKVDNLTLAFKMIEEAEIKTNFLKNTHLLDHDLKMILGMIWAFILDYAIKGISVDELTAKEGLLLWVQKKTRGYRDVDPPGVQNFHTHWKTGMALCALIHRHRPNLIDYDSLDKANDAANLELAFSVAEEHLDIPRLLDVEDLTDVARPDERSIMTYVSEFFHRFASEDVKEKAARRLQNFLNFMRKIQEMTNDYERRARALIAWTESQVKNFANNAFGETLAEAEATSAAFRSFVVTEKPQQAGERFDIEALFAEIQTELAVNGRRPYTPPDDCAPDAIAAAWQGLSTAEHNYATGVRDNRFRFVEKHETKIPQEKLDEMNAAFNHFDKNDSNTLDKIEFKAALSALSVPFKDDEAYNKVFRSVSEGNEQISREQYIAYCVALEEDRDTPEQLLASFETVAGDSSKVRPEALNCPPLTEEDIKMLLEQLTPNDDGTYSYADFVHAQFAQRE